MLSVPIHQEYAIESTTPADLQKIDDALHSIQNTIHQKQLLQQTLVITTTTPPSQLLTLLKSTGIRIVLRSCSPTTSSHTTIHSNAYGVPTSAVCLLDTWKESHDPTIYNISTLEPPSHDNKGRMALGILRFVQVTDTVVLVDIVVEGLQPHCEYSVTMCPYGDVSDPPASLGMDSDMTTIATVTGNDTGRGECLVETDLKRPLSYCIGQSVLVTPTTNIKDTQEHVPILWCGIIARSAGLFENTKTICLCSGRTLWQDAQL
jgi:copper chaperone for superoxide dismutase